MRGGLTADIPCIRIRFLMFAHKSTQTNDARIGIGP